MHDVAAIRLGSPGNQMLVRKIHSLNSLPGADKAARRMGAVEIAQGVWSDRSRDAAAISRPISVIRIRYIMEYFITKGFQTLVYKSSGSSEFED